MAFQMTSLGESARNEIGHCDGTSKERTQIWLRKISDHTAPMEAALLLASGPLKEVIQQRKTWDWKRLRRLLSTEFISSGFHHQQRAKLRDLKQRKTESTISFNWEFKCTAEEAYPDRMDDEDLILLYLSNIANRHMGIKIKKRKPGSLEEAMQAVREEEKVAEELLPEDSLTSKKFKASAPIAEYHEANLQQMDEMNKRLDHVMDAVKKLAETQVAAAAPPAIPSPTQAERKCFICGQPDHFAKHCPMKSANQKLFCTFCQKSGHTEVNCWQKNGRPARPNQQKTPYDAGKKCKRCRQTGHWSADCTAPPPKNPCRQCGGKHWMLDCPKFKDQMTAAPQTTNQQLNLIPPSAQTRGRLGKTGCGAKEFSGRPRCHLNVHGVNMYALLDTGSSRSLMTYAAYNRLPFLPEIVPTVVIYGVTGTPLDTVGECTVNICNVNVDVIIVHDLQGPDLIMGIPFLRQGSFDFAKGEFCLAGSSFKLDGRKERHVYQNHTVAAVTEDVEIQIKEVVKEYKDIFSDKSTPTGLSKMCEAIISTGDSPPIRQKPYRLPFSKREKAEECVQQMLEEGIIEPSNSPWASPITLVPKPDGSIRFCIDYRKLNAVTVKDSHPIPNIQDVLDGLQGATVFSTLDLKSGYWQMPLHKEDQAKSAFVTQSGCYQFRRLPFGLVNAPSQFQREMNRILSGLIGKICFVYIDDVIVYSKNPEDHPKHLEQVFQRLREHSLQLKQSKCCFGLPKVQLLGHTVSAEGTKPQVEKVEAILQMEPPSDARGVRRFLGMAGYYRRFIPRFSEIACPLTELTKTKQPFLWTPECEEAFQTLKTSLSVAPVLHHPDPKKPFKLFTDASHTAIGAILTQEEDGVDRPLAYLSHKLSGCQLRWATIEKEAYAVIYSLKKFHCYLFGSQFTIFTDHKPLKSLFQAEIKNTKMQRWAIQISEYGAEIKYIEGKNNIHADCLSRCSAISTKKPYIPPVVCPQDHLTDEITTEELQELQKAEFPEEWAKAESEADDEPFVIEAGLLYVAHNTSLAAWPSLQLLLPQQFRQVVIDRAHEELAHAGFAKTCSRICESYTWPGLRRKVRAYLATCQHCATTDPRRQRKGQHKIETPPGALHTWAIDMVGPFKRDQRGRQYLLTMIDCLTGWCEAIPLASKRADLVSETIINDLVARYGIPSVIRTDNGGEFINATMEKWMNEYGVKHIRTSPYHASGNGFCERLNGHLQKILVRLTGGNDRQWSKYLPEALHAYRIMSGPTGLSPYQALYGKRPKLPKVPDDTSQEDRMKALRLAEQFIREARELEKNRRLKKQTPVEEIPVGTFVTVQVLSPKKGQLKFENGFQVLSSYKGALRVVHMESGQVIRVHRDRVRVIPAPKSYDEVDPQVL